jgi:hypothetical protein
MTVLFNPNSGAEHPTQDPAAPESPLPAPSPETGAADCLSAMGAAGGPATAGQGAPEPSVFVHIAIIHGLLAPMPDKAFRAEVNRLLAQGLAVWRPSHLDSRITCCGLTGVGPDLFAAARDWCDQAGRLIDAGRA